MTPTLLKTNNYSFITNTIQNYFFYAKAYETIVATTLATIAISIPQANTFCAFLLI